MTWPTDFPNEDEAAVLANVQQMAISRLLKGRESYGPMKLTEVHGFWKDIEEEAFDLMMYLAMEKRRIQLGLEDRD